MANRVIDLVNGEFYHIYNRGVDKRNIFESSHDYERFIDLLYLANSSKALSYRNIKSSKKGLFTYDREETLVSIGAYCLMPNHFHLLITPYSEESAAKFMSKLSTAYTMYFNKKNNRSGSLFQGTYKAKHANSDEYLKYLFSYIHLNPSKASLTRAKTYQYSSLFDYYSNQRPEKNILDKKAFPEYFVNTQDLDAELLGWLEYKNTEV